MYCILFALLYVYNIQGVIKKLIIKNVDVMEIHTNLSGAGVRRVYIGF